MTNIFCGTTWERATCLFAIVLNIVLFKGAVTMTVSVVMDITVSLVAMIILITAFGEVGLFSYKNSPIFGV
jgi:Na+/H+ antiporter NhaD/arsenite permease-like protein